MNTEQSQEKSAKLDNGVASVLSAKEEIASKGFLTQVVPSPNRRTPSHTYSVGLSAKTGYEFIMFGNAPLAIELIEKFATTGTFPINAISEWDAYTVKNEKGTVPLRYIVKATVPSKAHHFGRAWFNPLLLDKPPENVYQIFLPDGANRLPGEPGFMLPAGAQIIDLTT